MFNIFLFSFKFFFRYMSHPWRESNRVLKDPALEFQRSSCLLRIKWLLASRSFYNRIWKRNYILIFKRWYTLIFFNSFWFLADLPGQIFLSLWVGLILWITVDRAAWLIRFAPIHNQIYCIVLIKLILCKTIKICI